MPLSAYELDALLGEKAVSMKTNETTKPNERRMK